MYKGFVGFGLENRLYVRVLSVWGGRGVRVVILGEDVLVVVSNYRVVVRC